LVGQRKETDISESNPLILEEPLFKLLDVCKLLQEFEVVSNPKTPIERLDDGDVQH